MNTEQREQIETFGAARILSPACRYSDQRLRGSVHVTGATYGRCTCDDGDVVEILAAGVFHLACSTDLI